MRSIEEEKKCLLNVIFFFLPGKRPEEKIQGENQWSTTPQILRPGILQCENSKCLHFCKQWMKLISITVD